MNDDKEKEVKDDMKLENKSLNEEDTKEEK